MAFSQPQLELLEANRAQQQVLIEELRAELAQVRTQAATAARGGRRQGPDEARIVDTRIGKPPNFQGDEASWPDWSLKMRAYTGAVSPAMGALLEDAELKAHDEVWNPHPAPDAHEDTQLRFLLIMLCQGARCRSCVVASRACTPTGRLRGATTLARRPAP